MELRADESSIGYQLTFVEAWQFESLNSTELYIIKIEQLVMAFTANAGKPGPDLHTCAKELGPRSRSHPATKAQRFHLDS